MVGYFKMRQSFEEYPKNYSSNFDGNGFRYLVQAMMQEIRSGESYLSRVTRNESAAILKVVSDIVAASRAE